VTFQWYEVQDFGEHGREFVSSETGLRLLQLLASDAELAEFCERQGIEVDPLRRALRHTVLEVCADNSASRMLFCPAGRKRAAEQYYSVTCTTNSCTVTARGEALVTRLLR
jgi:hypothetical protein